MSIFLLRQSTLRRVAVNDRGRALPPAGAALSWQSGDSQLKPPPFFRKSAAVKALHLGVLGITYGLALAFFPGVSRGVVTHAFFAETYLGGIAACMVLSALALFLSPGLWLYAAIGLRCYVLLVLGYSIGGCLSAKLVLGIGAMVEICVLVAPPAELPLAFLALAAFCAAQAWPSFFGPSALVDESPLPRPEELASLAFALGLSAVATARIARDATRQAELAESIRLQVANLDTLAELNRNLQGYARTIDEVSAEKERNRISREIHDISGYIFTNLIALMDAAGSMRRDDQAGLTDILVTARSQAQEGLRETRAALRRLRSERAESVDATRSIFKIVSIFRKVAGIDVELNLGNLPHFLAGDLNLALYRTVQEALTNAVRHGRASYVRVNFWVEEGTIDLSISDNGKGAFEVVKGIGLTGMEERIGALGGEVRVGKAPEGGFSLRVRVPLKTADPPA